MCPFRYSIIIFVIFIFDAHALTCRSSAGPKESELKNIYKKCLKMQDGMNSSSTRDSGDQDWNQSRRNQRNDREGQMDSRRNNKDRMNRNDRKNMDDRMGSYGEGSDSYSKMGNRDRMGSDGRSGSGRDSMGDNQFGRQENVNGRNDFQQEFGSDFSDQHGYQSTQSSRRYKRERKTENSGNRSQFNPNSKRYQDSDQSHEKNSSEKNMSKDDIKKACALHCFLENLEMTAEDGMPDRYLVTHTLTKDVNNEDLKDFLQESIEECFQILDNENTEDKCEFSKNLLMCLSEKGRENCDDWKDDLKF